VKGQKIAGEIPDEKVDFQYFLEAFDHYVENYKIADNEKGPLKSKVVQILNSQDKPNDIHWDP
jgi:hypothetical protein